MPDCIWKILSLDISPELNALANVVRSVTFAVTLQEGDVSATYTRQITLPEPAPETPFTAFDELSEDQVILWVRNSLTAEDLDFIEDFLVDRLRAAQEIAATQPVVPPWTIIEQPTPPPPEQPEAPPPENPEQPTPEDPEQPVVQPWNE